MKAMLQVLALAILVAGCAGGAPRRSERELLNDYLAYAGPPVDSFRFFRLDGWQSLGPNQLILWSTPWDAYLVTVAGPCPELEFTNRLGVTSTVGTVSRFESIVVRHHERCPIGEIRPLDLKQMKADRAAERAAAKARAATEQPR
jgi:hypothetical protein